MDSNGCFITGTVYLEWTNIYGNITRKIRHKTATLTIIRNEHRHMFIQVLPEKACNGLKFLVKDIKVFNKFMSEGKASIKFPEESCTIFISNSPVAPLVNFMKILFIKLAGKEDDKTQNSGQDKKHGKQIGFLRADAKLQDISPATDEERRNAREKARKLTASNLTTPSPTSRKRKLPETSCDYLGPNTPKLPRGKKLYLSSPSTFSESITKEQKRILDSVLSGCNVFFTGSAGTGKSYLLKKIINALPPDVTAITASTGVAACHIGGTTLHRFAGIGLGNANIDECGQLVLKNSTACSNWRKVKHLIIDEISMVDGDYFDKLEAVARYVRKNNKPFGGIQLVLCGDFFQLPPVGRRNENVQFCFQSKTWPKCVQINFELKIVHRQKDEEFINILNSIRKGEVTTDISKVLQATASQTIESDGILATRLCSHVNEANEINQTQLDKLEGEAKVYAAEDSIQAVSHILDRDLPVPSKLTLKIGAQVMLLKNVSIGCGLANGARGVVVKFVDELPIVHFRSGEYYKVKIEKWSVKLPKEGIVSRKQIPLKLAWAFSIHKSQGLTLDCVEMNLSRVFDAGQAYVALSRAQSLKTLRVLDFDMRQVWANQDVKKFYNKFQRQLEHTELIPLGKKRKASSVC